MRNEYLTLGPVPADEPCAQVGADDYSSRSLKECGRFIGLLKRMFPGMVFGIKKFPHDFGSYHEVCVFYDPDDHDEENEAYAVEGDVPYTWEECEEMAQEADNEG